MESNREGGNNNVFLLLYFPTSHTTVHMVHEFGGSLIQTPTTLIASSKKIFLYYFLKENSLSLTIVIFIVTLS